MMATKKKSADKQGVLFQPVVSTGLDEALRAIASLAGLDEEARVAAYNSITSAAASIVRDVSDDPVLAPHLVRSDMVDDNTYNPNHTAHPEMVLLETSIREDGVTMPVVTAVDPSTGRRVVVDGFHRKVVITKYLGRRYVPCSLVKATSLDARMAATVRHNRARGKHGVVLMGELVKALVDAGWSDDKIAEHLGMSVEELLRLKQSVGAAKMLSAKEYGPAWQGLDGPAGLEGEP